MITTLSFNIKTEEQQVKSFTPIPNQKYTIRFYGLAESAGSADDIDAFYLNWNAWNTHQHQRTNYRLCSGSISDNAPGGSNRLGFVINGIYVDNYWSPQRSTNGEYIFTNVDTQLIPLDNGQWNFAYHDCGPGNNNGTLYIDIQVEMWNHDVTQSECPISYVSPIVGPHPIELNRGEKTEKVTDIAVNTPAGALAFTRSFRQSKLDASAADAFTEPIGLGWSHNHHIYLFEDTTNHPDKLLMKMPAGGIGHFSLRSGTSDQYDGDPGSNSTIDASGSGTSMYTLTASDESLWVFDDQKRLRTRTWANGEVWTYSYDGNGRLDEVDDGYGRQLVYRYYTTGNYIGQLRFVGDQTFDDSVDPDNPTGRFAEYTYVQEKLNGIVVTSPESLLSTVTDVRSEDWTYDYYGQNTGETDSNLANWLISFTSPQVDLDGDDVADDSLIIKELDYTLDTVDPSIITDIEQSRGKAVSSGSFLTVTDYEFDRANNQTIITENGDTTRESKHHFNTKGLYLSSEDPDNNLVQQGTADSYRPDDQQDANNNSSQMSWSADGKLLNDVTNALNNTTNFSYDSQDRLESSTDAEGRVTTYLYDDDNRREPSQIVVADEVGVEKAINGDMEADSDWSNVGTPTKNEQSSTKADVGIYSRYVESIAGEGIQSNASITFVANKTYLITARVFVVNNTEQVKMNIPSAVSALSDSDGEWETLRMVYQPTGSPSPAQLQFLAENAAADFYVDSVHVTEIDEVQRWQQFVYDGNGRVLEEALIDPDSGLTLQKTARSYGTSGNGEGLLAQVTQYEWDVDTQSGIETHTNYTYDAQGRVIKVNKTSMFGTCEFTYTVYDEAGNVLGTACGLVNATAPTAIEGFGGLLELYDDTDATKKYTRITTHTYDALSRRVTTTSNAEMSNERTSRTIYDALGRVVRTIQNYNSQNASSESYTAPGTWTWNATTEQWEDTSTTPKVIEHGSNDDENIISDTEYNARGLVALRRDVLGRVTLYGYDLADRLVKTVQNAGTPNYDASYATGDPDLSAYTVNSVDDEDVITEQVYDPAGNVVKTIDARGAVSFTAYDALNRPVKVIQNAAQSSYAVLSDLDLSAYGAYSTSPDEDMVSETIYDAMGRVTRSKRLLENRGATEVWDESYFVYDSLGRQVRTVQHYVAANPEVTPDNWEWANNQWEDGSTNAINHGDNDQNIITETEYDSQGRVSETLDVNRRVTHMVYDGLNRQVKTIANYVSNDEDPPLWVWDTNQWEESDGTAIDHGTDFDQNIISETIYDSDGRVEETRNVIGLINRNAYNAAGQQYLSVSNYVAASPEVTPDNWEWDSIDTRWEDGSNLAIARGTGYDQNLISQPEYDDEHRVFQTRDVRGHLTRQVYDEAGRRVMSIANYVEQGNPIVEPDLWEWNASATPDPRWEDGSGAAISFGTTDKDQNRISSTTYDILGRVASSRDVQGRENIMVYDNLGRRVRSVGNYVSNGEDPALWVYDDVTDNRWEESDGTSIVHGTDNDQNIISDTIYNKAGQVLTTRDARGTETSFAYDAAGRRLSVTQAANTGFATTSYTCFDKAGRVLRSIQNYLEAYDWQAQLLDPDAVDANNNWIFAPIVHGSKNDENLISEFIYDGASRRVQVIDVLGNVSQTSYYLDGQVDSAIDPENVITVYRYDNLRRRKFVVQNYVSNGEDPSLWVWDTNQWEESDGTAIVHGTDKDQNIIVQVGYDIAGRMLSLRDPNGNETTYAYDLLGRRTSLTNPLSKVWATAYSEVNQANRTVMTYPNAYDVQRDFDHFGRLKTIDYNDSANTAKVDFDYSISGQRLKMTEHDGTSNIRETSYSYDAANRLTKVDFDTNGDTIVDDSVEYNYDIAGLRTKLEMPGGLTINYSYDQKGRLISLEDWDSQKSEFHYDSLNRHRVTRRPNGMRSIYTLDAGGRLKRLRHENKKRATLAEFAYLLDKRGNRTQARELFAEPSATSSTRTVDYNDATIQTRGNWTEVGGFYETENWDAALSFDFVGNVNVELDMGEGADHSLYDVYIDGTLWQSFDGYAATAGTRTIDIPLRGNGWHTLELRNRHANNLQSSAYKLRFKALRSDSALTEKTIDYSYDDLSRLLTANYADGSRSYAYQYDVAGNRLQELATIGITPTTTDWTYNAANQIATMKVGSNPTTNFSYDNNGNLTSDGQFTYTWDRASRLTTLNTGSVNHHYAYDGDSRRVQQTVGGIATNYLLDVQPQLALVLSEATPTDTLRYVHTPFGIESVEDNAGDWHTLVHDGLGSVRSQVDDLAAIEAEQQYSPYGQPFDLNGTFEGSFGYTGEQVDDNGLSFLRARYYDPNIGVFASLDPFEGMIDEPMSINGYGYVHGNPTNMIDPSGMSPDCYAECEQYNSPMFVGGQYEQCLNGCFSGNYGTLGDYYQQQGPIPNQPSIWQRFLSDPAAALQSMFCGGSVNFGDIAIDLRWLWEALKLLGEFFSVLGGILSFILSLFKDADWVQILARVIEWTKTKLKLGKPIVMDIGTSDNYPEVRAIYNARQPLGLHVFAVEEEPSRFKNLALAFSVSPIYPVKKISDRLYRNENNTLSIVRRNVTGDIPERDAPVVEMISMHPTYLEIQQPNNFVAQAVEKHLASAGLFYMVTESRSAAMRFMENSCGNILRDCPPEPNEISYDDLISGNNTIGIPFPMPNFAGTNYEVWGQRM